MNSNESWLLHSFAPYLSVFLYLPLPCKCDSRRRAAACGRKGRELFGCSGSEHPHVHVNALPCGGGAASYHCMIQAVAAVLACLGIRSMCQSIFKSFFMGYTAVLRVMCTLNLGTMASPYSTDAN